MATVSSPSSLSDLLCLFALEDARAHEQARPNAVRDMLMNGGLGEMGPSHFFAALLVGNVPAIELLATGVPAVSVRGAVHRSLMLVGKTEALFTLLDLIDFELPAYLDELHLLVRNSKVALAMLTDPDLRVNRWSMLSGSDDDSEGEGMSDPLDPTNEVRAARAEAEAAAAFVREQEGALRALAEAACAAVQENAGIERRAAMPRLRAALLGVPLDATLAADWASLLDARSPAPPRRTKPTQEELACARLSSFGQTPHAGGTRNPRSMRRLYAADHIYAALDPGARCNEALRRATREGDYDSILILMALENTHAGDYFRASRDYIPSALAVAVAKNDAKAIAVLTFDSSSTELLGEEFANSHEAYSAVVAAVQSVRAGLCRRSEQVKAEVCAFVIETDAQHRGALTPAGLAREILRRFGSRARPIFHEDLTERQYHSRLADFASCALRAAYDDPFALPDNDEDDDDDCPMRDAAEPVLAAGSA